MTGLNRTVQRIVGVALLAVLVLLADWQSNSVLYQLVVPGLMALAAVLITQSVMAVALAIALLATIHTDMDAVDWLPSSAYPLIAVLGWGTVFGIAMARFRAYSQRTHDARWSSRQSDPAPANPDPASEEPPPK